MSELRNVSQDPMPESQLGNICYQLDACIDHASALARFADRLVGPTPEGESNVSEVPPGKVDEVASRVATLKQILSAVEGRLENVA